VAAMARYVASLPPRAQRQRRTDAVDAVTSTSDKGGEVVVGSSDEDADGLGALRSVVAWQAPCPARTCPA